MSDIVIYHNPECGTSRNTLAMIRNAGIEPDVIEYLKTPPDRERVRELVYRMGVSVREILRERGTPYAELNLGRASLTDEDLLDAIGKNPILVNRPIVVTPTAVKLCRPSDTVLDLLPQVPEKDFDKDDGTPFLLDTRIDGTDQDLEIAMINASLPTADLADAGQVFYRYNRLGGLTAGYGGFALCGRDVLLRSVARTESSAQNVGPTMVQLLMSRAFDLGARQAYALTATPNAKAFFEHQHFTEVDRLQAPAPIRATRQLTGLCPSTASLLTRRISL